MKDLTLKIEFFSPWNCSAGLSAGAKADSLVIKDAQGLPYIPGKTIKGLVREAVEDYVSLLEIDNNADIVAHAFGESAEKGDTLACKGTLFFSNACLGQNEANAITGNGVAELLYIRKASTSIGDNGIAVDHSLRSIEATVPCTLYAQVLHADNAMASIIKDAVRFIRHIGTGRNRGLGRCRFSIQEGGEA